MTNRYFYDPDKPARLAAIAATDTQIDTNEETFRTEDIGGGGDSGIPQGGPLTVDLDGGGQKITNLAPGVAADDAATVSQAGGTPFNGGTITDPLIIDNSNAATQGLTVDAGGANGKVAKFRSDTGRVIASIGSLASTDSPLPVFDVSKSTVTVTVDPAIGGFFGVADPSGSTILDVEGSGSVSLEPPSGSTDNPFTIRTQDGTVALIMFSSGITSFRQMLRADAGLLIKLNAAPADADIGASEVTEWFDDTNAAAAFKLKGKSADGTVVQATIPMASVNVLGFLSSAVAPDGAAVKYDATNRVLASAQQAALADLNLGTLTLLTDAITAIGTMQTKINSLLAKLRTAGVLAT